MSFVGADKLMGYTPPKPPKRISNILKMYILKIHDCPRYSYGTKSAFSKIKYHGS